MYLFKTLHLTVHYTSDAQKDSLWTMNPIESDLVLSNLSNR